MKIGYFNTRESIHKLVTFVTENEFEWFIYRNTVSSHANLELPQNEKKDQIVACVKDERVNILFEYIEDFIDAMRIIVAKGNEMDYVLK